jgi:SAM-dependent methyltransferase
MTRELPFSAAAERNTQPILDALKRLIAAGSSVLEIGSGTGQHCCSFAPALDVAAWQPTELAGSIESLNLRLHAQHDQRILAAKILDVAAQPWLEGDFDHVFTANTLHIMSWPQVLDCLRGMRSVLVDGGSLLVYGPFRDGAVFDTASNEAFDRSLRERDPSMGVRDLLEVTAEAASNGLHLEQEIKMPANNRLLVFRARA